MAKYLDPKNDLLFKKIFGQNKELLINFLNSFLPLGEREITEIEYLTPEMIPKTALGKNSIVDVRCIDNTGRAFIVEMQNEWSNAFSNRLLVNGSKAIVKQMNKQKIEDEAILFSALEPVYILAVVNSDVTDKAGKLWYHHLKIVSEKTPDLVIKGLEYIILELPKFKQETWTLTDKKMAVLWLRFLREIQNYGKNLPEEFLNNKYIQTAIELCEESALTPEELEAYDRMQDQIIWDKTIQKMEETVEEQAQEIEDIRKENTQQAQKIEELQRQIKELTEKK